MCDSHQPLNGADSDPALHDPECLNQGRFPTHEDDKYPHAQFRHEWCSVCAEFMRPENRILERLVSPIWQSKEEAE